MCTHRSRVILNGKTNYFNCGHCRACLTEKSDKLKNMIRAYTPSGMRAWMITLTYNNENLPFCFKEDFSLFGSKSILASRDNLGTNSVDVFRGFDDFHGFFRPQHLDTLFYPRRTLEENAVKKEIVPYASRPAFDLDGNYLFSYHSNTYTKEIHDRIDFYSLKTPTNFPIDDVVGVCYTPDFVNFMKRFRINFNRSYGFTEIKYFACSEYGTENRRPHFHVLCWLPQSFEADTIYKILVKSWTFCDWNRWEGSRREKVLSLAISPGDYLASYVNSFDLIPLCLQTAKFRPKTFHSKGFSLNSALSELPVVLDAIEKDKSFLSWKTVNPKGQPATSVPNLLHSKHLTYYFFPKPLGYNRLSPIEKDDLLTTILSTAQELSDNFRRSCDITQLHQIVTDQFSPDWCASLYCQLHKFNHNSPFRNPLYRLVRSYKYLKEKGYVNAPLDFLVLFNRYHNKKFAALLEYNALYTPINEQFDNLEDYVQLPHHPLSDIQSRDNPNNYSYIVYNTRQNSNRFADLVKHKDRLTYSY